MYELIKMGVQVEKKCSKCKEVKEIMYFSFRDRKNTEEAECRRCTNNETREYTRRSEEITKDMEELGITVIKNYL